MTSLETVQPRPHDLVLRQYMQHSASGLKANPYWHSPDHWYQWLVRLDCGCITETLTFGDESPPTEHRYHPARFSAILRSAGRRGFSIQKNTVAHAYSRARKTRSRAGAASPQGIYGARRTMTKPRGGMSCSG